MKEDGPKCSNKDAGHHVSRVVLVVVDAGQADPECQGEQPELEEGPEIIREGT